MLIFPHPVKADLNDEMSLPSITLAYGDGNKQRSPDGLNLPKAIWNIQCPVDSKAQSATLQSFLIGVGNHIPFLWQSPRDIKPEFYYITGKVGGTYRLGGGRKPDFFVRTMQFEYANIATVATLTPPPSPPPSPPLGSVKVNNSGAGWIVVRYGDISTQINLIYSISTTSGQATQVSNRTQTIVANSTGFFEQLGGAAGTSVTFSILPGAGYVVGTPSSDTIVL